MFCEILNALSNGIGKVSLGKVPCCVGQPGALGNIGQARKLTVHSVNKSYHHVGKLLVVVEHVTAHIGSGTIAGYFTENFVNVAVTYLAALGKLQNLAHALNVCVLANRAVGLEIVPDNPLHLVGNVLVVSHSIPLSVVTPAFWGRWFLRLASGSPAWQLLLSIFSGSGQQLFSFTFSTHFVETF